MTSIIFLFLLTACNHTTPSIPPKTNATVTPTAQTDDYLLRINDHENESMGYGYVNMKGDTVIALGKYIMCITDTFRSYAIVMKKDGDFIGIDRAENIIYKVFLFDNGPDYASEGLFRITENNKIGYADATTGAVVIKPQFECAWPFEEGTAKVSNTCTTKNAGEHSTWESDHWFYIDSIGKEVNTPE